MELDLESQMLKEESLRLAAHEIMKRVAGETSVRIFTPIAEDSEYVRSCIDPCELYKINRRDPSMVCIVMRKGQTVETVKIETDLNGNEPVGVIFLRIRSGE